MLGRNEQALKSLENAYAILKELKDKRGQSAALANIGEWYGARWKKSAQKRDLLKAIELVEKACQMRRDGGFDPALESEIQLAEYLLAAGKRKEAAKWAELAVECGRAKKDEHGRKMLKKAEALRDSLKPAKAKGARTVKAPPPASEQQVQAPPPARKPGVVKPRRPRGKPPGKRKRP
jgi:tetratricopeptide (TPR) repeat protein